MFNIPSVDPSLREILGMGPAPTGLAATIATNPVGTENVTSMSTADPNFQPGHGTMTADQYAKWQQDKANALNIATGFALGGRGLLSTGRPAATALGRINLSDLPETISVNKLYPPGAARSGGAASDAAQLQARLADVRLSQFDQAALKYAKTNPPRPGDMVDPGFKSHADRIASYSPDAVAYDDPSWRDINMSNIPSQTSYEGTSTPPQLADIGPAKYQWRSQTGDWRGGVAPQGEPMVFNAHPIEGSPRGANGEIHVHLSDPDTGMVWPPSTGVYVHPDELISPYQGGGKVFTDATPANPMEAAYQTAVAAREQNSGIRSGKVWLPGPAVDESGNALSTPYTDARGKTFR